jgi:hypothetical protein
MKKRRQRNKTRIYLNKLWIRISTAWWIITNPKAHWFLTSIDEKNLTELIANNSLDEVNLKYHGLVRYNIFMICKKVYKSKDEVDYILDKAQFEADAIERMEE